jgi:hypothetical protein
MSAASYPTFAAAQARVTALKARGLWPGVITRGDGTFALTFDPDWAPQ